MNYTFFTRIVSLCFGLLSIGLYGQQYPVSAISEELLENAQAVVRTHTAVLQVKDEKRAELTVERVITVFNRQAAENMTTFTVYYDDFAKVGEIEAEIYDKSGKRIRKVKHKEIVDRSASGSNLASDSRVKISTLTHSQFPYTARFRYSKTIKGIFSLPRWSPMVHEAQAIQHAQLQVIVPNGMEFRYKALNVPEEPIIQEGAERTFTWTVKNISAIELEPEGPSGTEYIPIVYLAPHAFEIDGYKGSLETWKDFGTFYHTLNEGRDKLPKELAEKVQELTKDLTTNEEKIQVLYRYMQDNTRYVSIQLGIGGWQSFSAESVYKNGYGDCKALSNYVKSMLAEVGIPAHPAMIRAGDFAADIMPDFSGTQFNHVILCVPNEGDSLWLECTVNSYPIGYLGQFTEDRYALLATPEGGKLVRTPSSPPEANRQQRHALVSLDKAGNAQVHVTVDVTGYQQDNLLERVDSYSASKKEKWLRQSIDAKSFDIDNYAFEGKQEASIPTYRYRYDLTARNWASASGTRFFLLPNQLQRNRYVPPKVDDRSQPVVTQYPYLDTDTIEYQLPDGYFPESMPEVPIRVESAFGNYTANIDFQPQEGKLIYTRRLLMHKTRRPADEYEAYRDFLQKIVKADKVQVVLSGRS